MAGNRLDPTVGGRRAREWGPGSNNGDSVTPHDPGSAYYRLTKGGVEHWHGAAPDQDLVQLTIDEGEVTWLEPVTDAVYKAALGKK